jgi:hypothetical protein
MVKNNEYIIEADDMTMTIVDGRFKGSIIDNIKEIQKTIYKFGPMVVGMWGDSNNTQLNNLNDSRNRNNIISQQSFGKDVNGKSVEMDHDVLLVGWGTLTDNTQYWILQNSWGENFGYQGFFGIKIDNRSPHKYFYRYTYVKDIKDTSLNLNKKKIKNLNKNSYDSISKLDLSKFKYGKLSTSRTRGTTGGNKLPNSDAELNTFYADIKQSNLSAIKDPYKNNFCWGSGDNWIRHSILIRSRSQGTCGSCWLFAAISMIQSAISIHTIINYKIPFNVPLSEQWVLNNMRNLDGLDYKNGCEGGNVDMLKVIVNGFKGLVRGKGSIQHDGLGLIPNKDCTYKCSKYNQTGSECFLKKCEKGPAFRSQSRKYTPPPKESPFLKNLKKFWKDNSLYIIIGIAVIVVIIIIFAMKK